MKRYLLIITFLVFISIGPNFADRSDVCSDKSVIYQSVSRSAHCHATPIFFLRALFKKSYSYTSLNRRQSSKNLFICKNFKVSCLNFLADQLDDSMKRYRCKSLEKISTIVNACRIIAMSYGEGL